MEKTKETAHILDQLYVTLDQRKGADPETSYTAKLFRKGTHKIAQKVGEEAVETLIEAVRGKPDRLVSESADLLYHLLVLWADAKVKPERVWAELARRESIPGFAHIAAENEETN